MVCSLEVLQFWSNQKVRYCCYSFCHYMTNQSFSTNDEKQPFYYTPNSVKNLDSTQCGQLIYALGHWWDDSMAGGWNQLEAHLIQVSGGWHWLLAGTSAELQAGTPTYGLSIQLYSGPIYQKNDTRIPRVRVPKEQEKSMWHLLPR